MNKTLFQVNVFDAAQGHEVPVGPAMDNAEALLGLVEKINLSVMKGQIKGWRDAHVVQIITIH